MNTETHKEAARGDRPRYVLLEGIEHSNRFFSINTDRDPTKSATGETWYRILGYADSVTEAQSKLYGSPVPEASQSPTLSGENKKCWVCNEDH